MIDISSALTAFQNVCGVSASKLSIVLRTILYTSMMLWVAYSLIEQYKLMAKGESGIEQVFSFFRRLLLCVMILLIVS